MDLGYNGVTLLGRAAADPMESTSVTGKPVCWFTLVTAEPRMNPDTGRREPIKTWVRIVAFGGVARLGIDHVRKGTKLLVVGRLSSREKPDGGGVVRTVWEVVAERIVLLSSPDRERERRGKGNGEERTGDEPPF